MERLIQILDDLDDLVAAIGLVSERIRNFFRSILILAAAIAAQAGGIMLALIHPPLALATALLLFVTLLYRTVTTSHVPLEIA
jgi:predicted PurR-regulated permease PerM